MERELDNNKYLKYIQSFYSDNKQKKYFYRFESDEKNKIDEIYKNLKSLDQIISIDLKYD